LLQALGARITGYSFEPRPKSLEGSPAFAFVPGNMTEPRLLPFPDASFDAAVSVGVLEHVGETGGDERASLAELARVTRPRGLFFTYHLPNRGGWIENVGRALKLKKYFHPRRFDRDEIATLWNDAGFDILEIGLYDALPRAELRRLPGFLRHSPAFAAMYDAGDDLIARVVPWICTTFFVVAQRRG
jgi:SAM-dependent methyltransferase